jgi:hypothetical protein
LTTKKRRIVATLASLMLIGFIGAAVSGRIERFGGRHDRFVLPAGYSGPFIAIYDQPNGVTPSRHGDTAIYIIPMSGVLRIAAEEPPHYTKVSFAFPNSSAVLQQFATCADMREYRHDGATKVCWLDFAMGGTGIPDHIIAVITDWNHIPDNFNRSTFVYDSVLFGGKGKARQNWEEPRSLNNARISLR